jgi:hypothetical protein
MTRAQAYIFIYIYIYQTNASVKLGLQIEGFYICNFFIKTDFHLEILQTKFED